MDGDEELIARVFGKYSKSSVERLRSMIDACRYVEDKGIPGDVVECGVWRGGNIILARLLCPSRVCWLYDTFDGMTEPDKVDTKADGYSASIPYFAKLNNGHKWALATRPEVETYFRKEGVFDESKCKFVVGDVCKTLKVKENLPEKISLLRLDTDFYRSTKKELEVLYPLLSPGGILIIDDYNHWMGARQATQEYFKKKGIRYEQMLKPIDYTAVVMIKGKSDDDEVGRSKN